MAHQRTVRKTITGGLVAGLAGAMLLGPVSPTFAATEPASTDAAASCVVDTAELKWGVKERFRNYISGSIANGEWTMENGVTYETPAFTWTPGTGTVQPDLEAGSVDFTGDVHFTGNGGLMRLDLHDPSIEFTGPGAAQLVVGLGSADTAEAEVTIERVAAAVIDVSAGSGEGSSYSVTDAPVRLTAAGAEAFNGEYGDYVAGGDMDGLSLSLTVSGCELGVTAAPAPEPPVTETPEAGETLPAPQPEAGPEIPWIPIAIGGVALIAIGVTTGMLLAGRKRPAAEVAAEDDASQPTE